MRALLDVNVLIALLDPDHSMHSRARSWMTDNARFGWASCPITQNGCVRILSHPSYPGTLPVSAVIARLKEATLSPLHEFWPDDRSLLDPSVADPRRIHGPRQITDVYLLALAAGRGGRFVTFDHALARTAVPGAEASHLLAI